MPLTKSQKNKAIDGINKFCGVYRQAIELNKEIISACGETGKILNSEPIDYVFMMNRDICILIRQSEYINKINNISNKSHQENKKLEELILRFAETLTECRKNWIQIDQMLMTLIECLK
jgi:hypothetical protein